MRISDWSSDVCSSDLIGGASTASGVSQRMIRHYEKIGLIPPPPRRDGGYRDYSEPDVYRLRFIATVRDPGLPIEKMRRLLDVWSDSKRVRQNGKESEHERDDS